MNATTATAALAAEFATVYPAKGTGRIHHRDCPIPAYVRGGVIKDTHPAAIRNGLATMAECCRTAHERRMFDLYRVANR